MLHSASLRVYEGMQPLSTRTGTQRLLPSYLSVYPRKADILTTPATNVLTIVDPATTTGRTYTLSEAECSIASQKLQVKLSTA
eukprot:Em0004g1293a